MGDQDAPRGKAAYHLLWLKELTDLEKNLFPYQKLIKNFPKKLKKRKDNIILKRRHIIQSFVHITYDSI